MTWKKLAHKIANRVAGPQTWMAPGHFYSPIVDPNEIKIRRDKLFDRTITPAEIDWKFPQQADLLKEVCDLAKVLHFKEPRSVMRFQTSATDSTNFHAGEATILGGIILKFRPKRIVEFGCGQSSCAMLDINDEFFGGSLDLTFIDPYPELLKRLAGDLGRASVIKSPAQDIDMSVINMLEENDLLFIDSTHVSKCGSDVNFHLFEVLPRLKSGVLIHFHDVFYPFEYPERWFTDTNRSWNEDYILRAFLMNNSRYEIMLMNNYFASNGDAYPAAMAAFPFDDKRLLGSSLYIQKH